MIDGDGGLRTNLYVLGLWRRFTRLLNYAKPPQSKERNYCENTLIRALCRTKSLWNIDLSPMAWEQCDRSCVPRPSPCMYKYNRSPINRLQPALFVRPWECPLYARLQIYFCAAAASAVSPSLFADRACNSPCLPFCSLEETHAQSAHQFISVRKRTLDMGDRV